METFPKWAMNVTAILSTWPIYRCQGDGMPRFETPEFASAQEVLEAVREGSTEFGNFESALTVNSKGFFGNSPLIPVITWGNIGAVRLLAEGGARLNEPCEGGNTALHHAIAMGEFEIARVLIALGADTGLKNAEGKLARDLCWEGEWAGIFDQ